LPQRPAKATETTSLCPGMPHLKGETMPVNYHNRNIVIDGDAKWPRQFSLEQQKTLTRIFEDGVLRELRTISSRKTGNAVLEEIHRSAGRALIVSRLETKGGVFDVAQSDVLVKPILATKEGRRVPGRLRIAGLGGVIPGLGSDAKVRYSPPGVFGAITSRGPGSNADEILLHELVHALRSLQGVMDRTHMLQNEYRNTEEFIAMLVANIYLSEKGKPTLRGSYDRTSSDFQFAAMPEPEKREFLDRHHGMIEVLSEDQPGLTNRLSDVACAFNPVREYWARERKSHVGGITITP
jgi:hypothetical protein